MSEVPSAAPTVSSVAVEDKTYRRKVMARVRSRDTKPELALRRLVFGLGYRYRLHVTRLPGTPDLVFPRKMAVIFLHGCFLASA